MTRKVSTTIQLPKHIMDALNRYRDESGVSKNVIIERCLQALFEGRIIDLPKDIMARLRKVEEDFGSSPSFIIDKALRLFFAQDIEVVLRQNEHT